MIPCREEERQLLGSVALGFCGRSQGDLPLCDIVMLTAKDGYLPKYLRAIVELGHKLFLDLVQHWKMDGLSQSTERLDSRYVGLEQLLHVWIL